MKIALTGTSGSGKTTLANWISEYFQVPFISGSAGDILTQEDRMAMRDIFGVEEGAGHAGVIKSSMADYSFGMAFQQILLKRRTNLILYNPHFVTDRSPLDNITFMINQCGFHKEVTDRFVEVFIDQAIYAWEKLDGLIYIKPCQPERIEDNGSRVTNRFYQSAVDAQFQFWLDYLRSVRGMPKVCVIHFWNLDARKELVKEFINGLF
jgi:hypothetical protein